MANGLVAASELDLAAFGMQPDQPLPDYAHPLFLRILERDRSNATFRSTTKKCFPRAQAPYDPRRDPDRRHLFSNERGAPCFSLGSIRSYTTATSQGASSPMNHRGGRGQRRSNSAEWNATASISASSTICPDGGWKRPNGQFSRALLDAAADGIVGRLTLLFVTGPFPGPEVGGRRPWKHLLFRHQ